jgi:hypothetical protein
MTGASIGVSVRESLQCDGGVQSGQRLADAVVDAGGECEVLRLALPMDVEPVGIRVDLWIAIRGSDQCDDEAATVDRHSGQFGRLRRVPPGPLHWRVKPQRVLDGLGRQAARVRAQRGPLAGVVKQGVHRIPDEVDGGFNPATRLAAMSRDACDSESDDARIGCVL